MSKIDHSLFSADENALEGEFGQCPSCGGKLLIKRSKKGSFVGCSNYPSCEFAKPLYDNQTQELKIIEGSCCPECSQALAVKKGRYGLFIGCTNYPDCHHIEALKQKTDTLVDCPQCKSGRLAERTNKFGKRFFACDKYPKCKFLVNSQPVSASCPECGCSIMLKKANEKGSFLQCPKKTCNTKVID